MPRLPRRRCGGLVFESRYGLEASRRSRIISLRQSCCRGGLTAECPGPDGTACARSVCGIKKLLPGTFNGNIEHGSGGPKWNRRRPATGIAIRTYVAIPKQPPSQDGSVGPELSKPRTAIHDCFRNGGLPNWWCNSYSPHNILEKDPKYTRGLAGIVDCRPSLFSIRISGACPAFECPPKS